MLCDDIKIIYLIIILECAVGKELVNVTSLMVSWLIVHAPHIDFVIIIFKSSVHWTSCEVGNLWRDGFRVTVQGRH